MTNPQQTLFSMVKNWKHFPSSQEQEKGGHSHHTIQYNFGSFRHSNQRRKIDKRNPAWKRSKTLTVCRWHDPLYRKPERLYEKITRANQWI